MKKEKILKVLRELEEKRDRCGAANNAAGTEAYKACQSCRHSLVYLRRRGSDEDIANARQRCDKAVSLMNPESREHASKRNELEELKKKTENAYADIKNNDPNMSDDRINTICAVYEKHLAYMETLPWKQDNISKKKNIDLSVMSTEQKQDLTRHKTDVRNAVHNLLLNYKATTPVYRALDNVPNYCSWRYELAKKKKQSTEE